MRPRQTGSAGSFTATGSKSRAAHPKQTTRRLTSASLRQRKATPIEQQCHAAVRPLTSLAAVQKEDSKEIIAAVECVLHTATEQSDGAHGCDLMRLSKCTALGGNSCLGVHAAGHVTEFRTLALLAAARMVPLTVQQRFSERRRLHALILELRALGGRVNRLEWLFWPRGRELTGALQIQETEAKGARLPRASALHGLLFITSVTCDIQRCSQIAILPRHDICGK